jgi:hypothetical protein
MALQSHFMVVASIVPAQLAALHALLARMNHRPGMVNPLNELIPFGQFEQLHFARFVILNDVTKDDICIYGLPPPEVPISLAFVGDCDGEVKAFFKDLIQHAETGLRQIFSHCEGFNETSNLLSWLLIHNLSASASYINWSGRTVRQIREENVLWKSLVSYLNGHASVMHEQTPRQYWDTLRQFAETEKHAGRLKLTPRKSFFWWKVGEGIHALFVLLILMVSAPLILFYLPLFLIQLRRRERRDPEIIPRPADQHVKSLAELEDHDVTNQFTALGSVKPGRFRFLTVTFFLWMLNNACRHVYNRGRLTRVSTIHFAHWAFLEDKRRLVFTSNYDGALESYMDDFINKVGWGLNLVFSNGVGYPRTNWLLLNGSRYEQKFKAFLRRHQLPTNVWYNAYPGLTAVDLDRNTCIRTGIEKSNMSDLEIEEWLRLF